MYTNRQKKSALLVCTAFIVVTLFSVLFLAKEADHDCTGTDCPICACVQQVEQMLKQLRTGTSDAVNGLPAQMPAILLVFCAFLFVPCASPVSKKVRLNN